ncbi:tellurite resistance TerB family protein [Thalassospira sp. MCCC 1A03138]|uniref:tellurite resistance TerB family protein n=1 Tax=Thalassospira sp. MCCC 1A03138 TaxID=1470576 RepID=UPI000A1E1EDB|nr:tellurite resistance TerB family protein [Thalassospira sp. MCCC 1A03138]OSQ32946.1 membrane protein [Thalassospira sp. MCCC 1A03138]
MDIGKILGGVLGSGSTGQIGDRIKQATSGGSTGGIGKALGNSGLGGGLVGGALSGGLISAVLGSKKGRKMGGKVLAYGGTALVAGLAYKAWRDYSNRQKPQNHARDTDLASIPADSGFAPEQERGEDDVDFRLALVRAMIAAAKSDGHIDQAEHKRIAAQIEQFELGASEKAFLFDAFSADADPLAIARLARTSEQGAEIYLASSLSIDPDEQVEQQYLDRLAGCLGLPGELRAHLDTQAEGARREFAAK